MTTERIESELKYAEKVFAGDSEYDGADAARIIIEMCEAWLAERKSEKI